MNVAIPMKIPLLTAVLDPGRTLTIVALRLLDISIVCRPIPGIDASKTIEKRSVLVTI